MRVQRARKLVVRAIIFPDKLDGFWPLDHCSSSKTCRKHIQRKLTKSVFYCRKKTQLSKPSFKASELIFSIFVKRKTCLLCAVSIWHEHFEERIYIRKEKPFFRVFHRFLRNSLRGPKKCQKRNVIVNMVFSSKFLYSMFAADKRHIFSFHKNSKN